MYYVCQISGNVLGGIESFADLDEAKDCVMSLICEYGRVITDDIRNEINSDLSYLPEEGDWSICIGIIT